MTYGRTKTTTISVKLAEEDLIKLDAIVASWDPEDWKALDVDPSARWRSRYGKPNRGQILRALVRQASPRGSTKVRPSTAAKGKTKMRSRSGKTKTPAPK